MALHAVPTNLNTKPTHTTERSRMVCTVLIAANSGSRIMTIPGHAIDTRDYICSP